MKKDCLQDVESGANTQEGDMNNSLEPVAVTLGDPISDPCEDQQFWLDRIHTVTPLREGTKLYSPTTVEQLVRERDELVEIRKTFAERNSILWERDRKCFEQLTAMTGQRDRALDLQGELDNECEELTAQLAASQAREQQLREALVFISSYPLIGSYEVVQREKASEALALPQDDTALRQWGAKLLREMALDSIDYAMSRTEL